MDRLYITADLFDPYQLYIYQKLYSKMPTIIALDVSLSMTRFIPAASNSAITDEKLTYHQLAIHGIRDFLNHLAKYSRLEYVALVSV